MILKFIWMVLVFGFSFLCGLVPFLWAKEIQAYELRNFPSLKLTSKRTPKFLSLLTEKLDRFAYDSKAGTDYVQILHIIGLSWMVVTVIAFVATILKSFGVVNRLW